MADSTIEKPMWDVIVVGAGPSGATCANLTAAAGLKVLLVDAKAFPRRKVCGGCLNQVSVELLHRLLGPQHTLWQTAVPVDAFEWSYARHTVRFHLPPGMAIDRSLLDQSLVTRAVELGCHFQDSTSAKLLAPSEAAREVELTGPSGTHIVTARIVILASGLGNRAAGSNLDLQQTSKANSRIGIETIVEKFPECYQAGTIHMVVGSEGYVGLTQICNQRLHVAAAVDRSALQARGPDRLIEHALRQSGLPPLVLDAERTWRGTPPLTARASHVADHRVFLIGDAAGYVEPFTGEGIRWAVESGMGVVPWILRAVAKWEERYVGQWTDWYGTHIAHRQRLCRSIAWGLKSPVVRWLANGALRVRPAMAHSIIHQLNTR
jgi:flavin-dependent dehydrogenase